MRAAMSPDGMGSFAEHAAERKDELVRALALSPFVRQRLTMFVSRHRQDDLETLSRFIEGGQFLRLSTRRTG
jgi:hypothetical protein